MLKAIGAPATLNNFMVFNVVNFFELQSSGINIKKSLYLFFDITFFLIWLKYTYDLVLEDMQCLVVYLQIFTEETLCHRG